MARHCGHYDEATISGRLVDGVLRCPDCLVTEIKRLRGLLVCKNARGIIKAAEGVTT